ncbi:G5 domain-containing protein [Georgenia sp. Z1491]|uniref:aggregation-promoting factor C-terminal-like domain-containing protein n=1 Tax=Georgenia sp. Z1491 TaxID=3416707 RepID=UPI003CF76E5E
MTDTATTSRRADRFRRHQRAVLASVLAGGALVVTGGVIAADAGLGADSGTAASAALVEPVDRGDAAGRSTAERIALDTAEVTTSFTVTVDGETLDFTTAAQTLDEALHEAGIQIGADDRVSAPLAGPVTDVEIVRVTSDSVTEEVIDEHGTSEVETDELEVGQTQVRTEGVDGRVVNTYRVTSAEGEEDERELVASVTVDERVDEVVLVGTREPEPVQAAPEPEPTEEAPAAAQESAPAEEAAPAAETPAYSGGDPRAIAQSMAASRGWGADQFSCLNSLWERESGWNPTAQNPSSGAYGIPQSLPGSKMAAAGADWRTNPATQIAWGLDYIAGRYGTPCGAWGHSESVGWY